MRKNPIKISSQTSVFLKEALSKTAKKLVIPIVETNQVNLQFKKIGLESIDVHHALKYVLLYSGVAGQGKFLSSDLKLKLNKVSREDKTANQVFNRTLFKDAVISALMPYGRSQLVKKKKSFEIP